MKKFFCVASLDNSEGQNLWVPTGVFGTNDIAHQFLIRLPTTKRHKIFEVDVEFEDYINVNNSQLFVKYTVESISNNLYQPIAIFSDEKSASNHDIKSNKGYFIKNINGLVTVVDMDLQVLSN